MGQSGASPTIRLARATVLRQLQLGPRSSKELGVAPDTLRLLRDDGTIAIDPDRFPGEYVPGNPLVCRLPDDDRPWPGWEKWNA